MFDSMWWGAGAGSWRARTWRRTQHVNVNKSNLLHSCCACCRFLEGEGAAADKRRNNRFKLIPSILKSSWVVKQAVGTTPVLLGNKLVTKYFRCVLPAANTGCRL